MDLSEAKLREYVQRLLLSRMRILCNHGFYGLLLMHMKYAVDEKEETACTDGQTITFGTKFLETLSDPELDFVMMHEIMHVALQHCFRTQKNDPYLFNVACDIVINSNILFENKMELSSITLVEHGESMHLTPDDREGYEFTAEEVYAMLVNEAGNFGKGKNQSNSLCSSWDDHSRWGTCENGSILKDAWEKRVKDAAKAIEIRDPSNQRGMLPMFAQRLLRELNAPQTDWRTILNEFVQEDIVDYSFSPPDRRFDGADFFLPDFNEKEDVVRDILFMIDTSGSMSDKMITAAYSEIDGAISQFNGKLRGWLGFFDAVVVEPTPFTTNEEFRIIRPIGGGGTNFDVIFDYVDRRMEQSPASIVILTDGYAPFPEERVAKGIPVLWLINNDKITPPWGKIARIQV